MRVHLFAVNSKGMLTAQQRVTMLWSSLLFLLNVDGVHTTTKRNWVTEIVSLSFIIMQDDVIRPDYCTSEPSEHSIGNLRMMMREFTVNDLISMISKIERMWHAMFTSNLLMVRLKSETDGYVATIDASTNISNHIGNPKRKKEILLHSGPVKIDTDPSIIDMLKKTNPEYSVANVIWPQLIDVLNNTYEIMFPLLKALGVK